MVEKDNQELKEEIRKWVSNYYLAKAFSGLRKATEYSQKCMSRAMLTMFVVFIGYVLLALLGIRTWLGFICFAGLILAIQFFFKRKGNRYWNQVAPTYEVLEGQLGKAIQSLPPLNKPEKEKLRTLMKFSQNKSITRERLKQKLEETLKLEKLRKWSFLRELHQYLSH